MLPLILCSFIQHGINNASCFRYCRCLYRLSSELAACQYFLCAHCICFYFLTFTSRWWVGCCSVPQEITGIPFQHNKKTNKRKAPRQCKTRCKFLINAFGCIELAMKVGSRNVKCYFGRRI